MTGQIAGKLIPILSFDFNQNEESHLLSVFPDVKIPLVHESYGRF